MSFPQDPVYGVAKADENPTGIRVGGVLSSVPSAIPSVKIQGHWSQTQGSSKAQAVWLFASGLYITVTGCREDDPGWTGSQKPCWLSGFLPNKLGPNEVLELQQETRG